MGVTMALPFLEAMVPARHGARARPRPGKVRLVGHRAGARLRWCDDDRPAEEPLVAGRRGQELRPLADQPDARSSRGANDVTIVSNTDVRNAEAFETPEIGGDHFRSSAVFLTQAHPRQTKGSNVHVGTSLDQHYAQKFGQETAIPSMQLCIEAVDQAGGCSYGYSCVYTDTISWAAPNQPLPMIRDPRFAFDQLFGVGATPEERRERRQEDRSILDSITSAAGRLRNTLGAADRVRLAAYLDEVREVERRIQLVEAQNSSGNRA